MRPYLVQEIDDPSGKVVARFGPQVVHTASVDTAGTMDFNQVMATVRQAMAGATDPMGTSGLLFLNYPGQGGCQDRVGGNRRGAGLG